MMSVTEYITHEVHEERVQRLQALGDLAAGVAHDFYHHIGIIRNFVKFLMADIGEEMCNDPKVQEHLSVIFDTLDQSEAQTNQLVSFARLQPVAPSIFSMNDLIAGLRPLLSVFSFEIEFDLDPDLLSVKADLSQTQQMLTNLLLNARDAGAKNVTITTTNALNGEYNPITVSLIVSDDGMGMTEEVRERCFQPYFSTKDVGSGLGLALVFGVVKRAHGIIRIDTAPGEGTKVTITLPAGICAQ